MTRGMKISVVTAALIGLMVGAVFGVKQGVWLSRSFDYVELMEASAASADFAAEQFKYADVAHAREAAFLQIKFLQLLRRAGHDQGDEKELGWAYVRLAMIEKSADQKEAERAALDKAREYFRGSHPAEELTDDQMKSALVQMDEAMERARL